MTYNYHQGQNQGSNPFNDIWFQSIVGNDNLFDLECTVCQESRLSARVNRNTETNQSWNIALQTPQDILVLVGYFEGCFYGGTARHPWLWTVLWCLERVFLGLLGNFFSRAAYCY
jgi:hypothetical protein